MDLNKKSSSVITLSYIIFGIFFCFNFIGTSLIQYYYLLVLLFTLLVSIKYPLQVSIFPLLGLFMIEGQGRILWSYHPLFRNIFDFLLIILILKSYILHKKVITTKVIPKFTVILIGLHFLWYLGQFANINNLGVLVVLAAMKIYIFPFLLFFYFVQNPISDQKILNRLSYFIAIFTFIQVILVIYQSYMGESFLISMHQYYSVGKQTVFAGALFRPYGTSQYPGFIGAYLTFLVGLMFLNDQSSFRFKLLITITIIMSYIALFLMQIRATMLKHLLIVIAIQLSFFIFQKYKIKKLILLFIFSAIALIGISTINFKDAFEQNPIYNIAFSRLESLFNPAKAFKARLNFSDGMELIANRLVNTPLGLGPGRTGAANSIAKEEINADQFYGPNYSWAFDNLFISLATDLGIGMIFYLLSVFSIPIYLISCFFKERSQKTINKHLIVSIVIMAVILLGNWGSITLPYNPDSLAFWLWAAIGLNYKEFSNA